VKGFDYSYNLYETLRFMRGMSVVRLSEMARYWRVHRKIAWHRLNYLQRKGMVKKYERGIYGVGEKGMDFLDTVEKIERGWRVHRNERS